MHLLNRAVIALTKIGVDHGPICQSRKHSAFGDLKGKVVEIAPATGSQFALLPPGQRDRKLHKGSTTRSREDRIRRCGTHRRIATGKEILGVYLVSVSREHEVDFGGKERTNRQALNILSACSYELSGLISGRYRFLWERIQASQPKL